MTSVHSIDVSAGTSLGPDDGVIIDDCGTILILPSRVRDATDAYRDHAHRRYNDAIREVYGSENGEGNGTPDASSRKQAKRDAAHAAAHARKAIKRRIIHDNVRRHLLKKR